MQSELRKQPGDVQIEAELRKQPGDGLYTAHRMARAIPLLTLAVTRKRPGDFSGDAQATRTSAFRYP